MPKLSELANQAAVAADGTLTLDYFTDQFDKKTQYAEFYEPKVEEPGEGEIPRSLLNPDNEDSGADEQPGGGFWSPEEEEPREVNPERFGKTGRNIARLIDTGFDFAMTNFVAKDSQKSYKASEKDIDDIAEAWSEIAEEKQWDLGPGWRLLLLYIIVYGPLTKQALADRRLAELERRADLTEETLRQQAERIKELENERYRENRGYGSPDNTAGSTEAPRN